LEKLQPIPEVHEWRGQLKEITNATEVQALYTRDKR
jgi:hypothetical protein